MDARLVRVLHGLPAPVDIAEAHAGKPANARRAVERTDLARDLASRLEVLVGGDRKARLDDIDAQARQLPRHLELLHRVHREARRLPAVPQRPVEDDYPIHGKNLLRLTQCPWPAPTSAPACAPR